MKILIVSIIVFVLNVPFGYWRANVKRFTLQWTLAIHIPIPFIITLRIYSDIGFVLYTYPILVFSFFLGQYIGSKYYSNRKLSGFEPISSCLVMDFYRKDK
jgi:hypothetical protein